TRIAEIATSPKEEGMIYFQDRDYRRAVDILQSHAADYTEDAEYLYYLGESLYFLARETSDIPMTEAAISYLEKARQFKKDCRYEIGLARFQLDLFGARARGLKNEDNEPFLFVHPKEAASPAPRVGVVLVHGFTACPWEVRELGVYLFKQGYDVYGVLLAGHGTKPEDLCDITWEQWYNSVENALTTIRMIADHIYLGGVSTGGSLCLLAASKYQVSGVISLASAIYLQDDMAMLASVGKYVKKYNIRPLKDKVKPYYYEERSVAAVGQLNELLSVVKKEIGKIEEPIIVFQSKEDKTIKPESGQFIYDNVSSPQREIVWFEASPHVLTTFENKEQQKTIETVGAFIKRIEASNNTSEGDK
ncbi:MAG: alpha/beta fold hydrolase, partial [Thermodesulfobacteriota bacterium]